MHIHASHSTAARQVRDTFGEQCFDALPKTVLALMVWHLADCASDRGIGNGGEVERMIQELDALAANNLIDQPQYKKCVAALKKINP